MLGVLEGGNEGHLEIETAAFGRMWGGPAMGSTCTKTTHRAWSSTEVIFSVLLHDQ